MECGTNASCVNGFWQWGYQPGSFCADAETLVATPSGERPIAELAPGDAVYSVDHDAIVATKILRVTRRRAVHHTMVRVVFDDGRVVSMSPGHPTADGRAFGTVTGGMLDGHRVESVTRVAYTHPFTYDILPDSDTGTYFAAGVRVGSTLFGGTNVGLFACGTSPKTESHPSQIWH
jgi:hypothetical protein